MPSLKPFLEFASRIVSETGRRCRARTRVAMVVGAALGLVASSAQAGDGSSFDVLVSAGVSGSSVSGTLNVTNMESDPIALSAITASIEVRFDDGVAIPALPAGSDVGWYRVAQVSLPAPVTLPAGASQSFPFTINPCSSNVAPYRSAKDMRTVGVVTAGRVRSSYSGGFPLPAPCPVCGNSVLEAGEQCDAGANGGGCCSATCQFRANGTLCSDANACTRADVCQAGACVGADPVVCTATDACRDAGTCNPATGVCSQPAKANGTACNDGNACTRTDSCQSGICRGGSPVVCSASGVCMTASCNPATGVCAEAAKPDGTTCSDASACTTGDQCAAGACVGGAPLVCNDYRSCTLDTCNAASGCSYGAAATCESCDAAQCDDCSGRCQANNDACVTGCWEGFWSCLNGCTSTYCAPFCQVDLGYCLDSCPTTAACQSACEAGNGCGTGCSGVEGSGSSSTQVPSFSRWGFVGLALLLIAIGGFELVGRGRRGDESA